MVKDEGTDAVVSGNNKYFFHYESYSIMPDPVQPKNFLLAMYIPIRDLTFDRPAQKQLLPIHPNCNIFDYNSNVANDIIKSVKQEYGEKGTFHIKSQGIKIYCKEAEISESQKRVSITISDKDVEGIIDGANLYNLLKDLRIEDIAKNSYIKVECIIGHDSSLSDELAKTLDKRLSIDKTLDINNKELDWLTEIIDDTDYKDVLDTIDVLAMIDLLRNNYYDSEVDNQPIYSYWDKQKVLELYKANPKSFKQYRTIVKDILYLYDYINYKTQEIWPTKKGSIGSLGISTVYKQKGYNFPILGKKMDYKLHDAVAYIILNGFRSFVIFNPDGTARWSKDFSKLLSLYEVIGIEIINIIRDYSSQMGHNPHLLGKNKMLYSMVYKEFMMGDMLNQFL
tara:strand:- start:929 stop:2113 length:1185 start_codon:yes stop_codon:yes gene_type:complete